MRRGDLWDQPNYGLVQRKGIPMKNSLIVLAALAALTACSQTEKTAAIGAASGAVIGGLVSNDWRGAAIGAAAGGVGGAAVGSMNERRECEYRDRYGRRYYERCR
jgi:uncharacterized membrane protein